MDNPGNGNSTDRAERPVVTVVGKLYNQFLIQCSWEAEGHFDAVSRSMLDQLNQLGVMVIDDPRNYLVAPSEPRRPISPVDPLGHNREIPDVRELKRKE